MMAIMVLKDGFWVTSMMREIRVLLMIVSKNVWININHRISLIWRYTLLGANFTFMGSIEYKAGIVLSLVIVFLMVT